MFQISHLLASCVGFRLAYILELFALKVSKYKKNTRCLSALHDDINYRLITAMRITLGCNIYIVLKIINPFNKVVYVHWDRNNMLVCFVFYRLLAFFFFDPFNRVRWSFAEYTQVIIHTLWLRCKLSLKMMILIGPCWWIYIDLNLPITDLFSMPKHVFYSESFNVRYL